MFSIKSDSSSSSTYPTGHQTETTKTRTDTKGTLTTELDGDETERLVTRGDESEVGTTEQVGRQRSELRFRVDTIWVHFHETTELLSRETTVEIDDGTDGDELDGGTLVKPEDTVSQQSSSVRKRRTMKASHRQ